MVAEIATSFGIGIGYEYDGFFISGISGATWSIQVLASTPFYSTITNTQVPELSLTDSFGSYDINTHIAVGWPLGQHVIIAASLDATYSKRNEVKVKAITLPENILIAIQPALTLHWSF